MSGKKELNTLNVDQKLAVQIMEEEEIHSVSAGYNHCAVVTKDGKLYTWGDAGFGKLGYKWDKGFKRTPK